MALSAHTITVTVDSVPVIRNFSLTMQPGSVHVIRGPNGAGKSSLAYALAGYPSYAITHGSLHYAHHDITHEPADKRAQLGVFLTPQQLVAIPGISIKTLLEQAYRAIYQCHDLPPSFYHDIEYYCSLLHFPYTDINRSLHEGFSGGEKKKIEIIQLLILRPACIILDEIDSGVDHDNLTNIVKALRLVQHQNPDCIICIITHNARITTLFVPDYVHVIMNGTLVYSGDHTVTQIIDTYGYDRYRDNYEKKQLLL